MRHDIHEFEIFSNSYKQSNSMNEKECGSFSKQCKFEHRHTIYFYFALIEVNIFPGKIRHPNFLQHSFDWSGHFEHHWTLSIPKNLAKYLTYFACCSCLLCLYCKKVNNAHYKLFHIIFLQS